MDPQRPDRRTQRTSLAREARQLADQVEALYIGMAQIGALHEISRYSQIHDGAVPRLNLLETARALRCYAGTLSMLAGVAPKPTTEGART